MFIPLVRWLIRDRADVIGLIAFLVLVTWWPWLPDPMNLPKLLVLVTGSLALAPFAVLAWYRVVRTPGHWPLRIMTGAALALLLWAVISSFSGTSPMTVTFYGWYARNDGLLTLICLVMLLLGASTLSMRQVQRLITWLMAAASVVAVVSYLQVLGNPVTPNVGGTINGTLGNSNFAAAFLGTMTVLSLTQVFASQRTHAARVWAGVLAAAMALLVLVLGSDAQGPATLGAALLGALLIWGLGVRGRWQPWARLGAVIATVASLIVLGMSFAGIGPLAPLWTGGTFQDRIGFWQSALGMAGAHPILGVGPGAFARFANEFRVDTTILLNGPNFAVSAAHNVPLHIAATLGWLATLLWIVLFAGTFGWLIWRVARNPMPQLATAAGVGAGLVGYLAQAMISIDMLTLVTTGWVLAGCTLAVAGAAAVEQEVPTALGKSAAKKRPTKRGPSRTQARALTPTWVLASSAGLGVAGCIAVLIQIMAVISAGSAVTGSPQANEALARALTPCNMRQQLAEAAFKSQMQPPTLDAVLTAARLDERCGRFSDVIAMDALSNGDLAEADRASAQSVQFDPLAAQPWMIRAQVLTAMKDKAGALAALDMAADAVAISPQAQGDGSGAVTQQIQDLRAAANAIS